MHQIQGVTFKIYENSYSSSMMAFSKTRKCVTYRAREVKWYHCIRVFLCLPWPRSVRISPLAGPCLSSCALNSFFCLPQFLFALLKSSPPVRTCGGPEDLMCHSSICCSPAQTWRSHPLCFAYHYSVLFWASPTCCPSNFQIPHLLRGMFSSPMIWHL